MWHQSKKGGEIFCFFFFPPTTERELLSHARMLHEPERNDLSDVVDVVVAVFVAPGIVVIAAAVIACLSLRALMLPPSPS